MNEQSTVSFAFNGVNMTRSTTGGGELERSKQTSLGFIDGHACALAMHLGIAGCTFFFPGLGLVHKPYRVQSLTLLECQPLQQNILCLSTSHPNIGHMGPIRKCDPHCPFKTIVEFQPFVAFSGCPGSYVGHF